MKRKIDQNRPALRGFASWRLMLGTALLCFLMSMNSFAQGTADYQALLDNLLQKYDYSQQVMTPQEFAAFQEQITSLQAKLGLAQVLPVTIPDKANDPAGYLQYLQDQLAGMMTQINSGTLTKAQIEEMMQQINALNLTIAQMQFEMGNGPDPNIPFSVYPPSTGMSWDPSKPF